jgi:hypothetical protein
MLPVERVQSALAGHTRSNLVSGRTVVRTIANSPAISNKVYIAKSTR